MKLLKLLKQHYGKIILGLFALWLLNLLFLYRHFSFKEEIKLSSGEVIVVYRQFKTKPLGEIGGSGGWEATYNSFEIVSPELPDRPPKWESNIGLIPLYFDHDSKAENWILVATIIMCSTYDDMGRPKYPYAEFRSVKGQWQRVPLSDDVLGRIANVFTNMSNSSMPWTVDLKMKKVEEDNPSVHESYKSILAMSSNC